MGGHHGKARRNGHTEQGPSTFNGQPSEVVYSKSMDTCSLKLYRVEGANDGRDELVVLLDCGGRVYANGRRVYPFENTTPSVEGMGDGACFPGTYKMAGELDKCLNADSNGTCTMDAVMSLIAQTFEQLLKDGIRLQDNLRVLEEENTALSLKVLELKREQLQMQKLELQKQKLELRIDELESRSSPFVATGVPPQQRRLANLVRTNSLGPGDANGLSRGNGPRRSESLNRVNAEQNGFQNNSDQQNNNFRNGHTTKEQVNRKMSEGFVRDTETRRNELAQETGVISFQMESLSREHELVKADMMRSGAMTRNRRISGGPAPSDGTMVGSKHISPQLYQSMERLNMDIEPRTNGKQGNGQWDRYDTIRRRYDALRQRRIDRVRQYSSQENVTRTSSRSRRSHDRQSITSDDDSSNNSRDSPPPQQLVYE